MEHHVPIENYLNKMKAVQKGILDYIDKDDNVQDNYLNLNHILEHMKILENPHETKSVFYLIARIVDNHHRGHDFFKKIEHIFLLFKDVIPKNFSNIEIFNIFESNKRVLLILFEMSLLTMDSDIATILTNEKFTSEKYPQFLYPEIKPFINEEFSNQISANLPKNYSKERKDENNDKEICQLIQKNSVDEFAAFIKKENIELTATIEPSIFNTSSFLTGKLPTLIEYSAFCGSFQIFNYLYVNHVQINQNVWDYAIHGGNLDIIHLLEQCKVKPIGDSFLECLYESIKCHENEIADHILSNSLNDEKEKKKPMISIEALKFYNFNYIEKELIDKSIFYNLCEYGYFPLVEILLKSTKVDVNSKTIFFGIFFNSISSYCFF